MHHGLLSPDTTPRHQIKSEKFSSFSFVFQKVILWPSVIVSALVASTGFGRANSFSKSLIMIRIICHCSGCKLRLVCRDVCLLMRCQTRTHIQQVTRSQQKTSKVQTLKERNSSYSYTYRHYIYLPLLSQKRRIKKKSFWESVDKHLLRQNLIRLW